MLVWARAAVLGPAVLASGVVSHVAADGLLPHPVLLVGMLAACVALAALFLGAPASPARLVLLLVGGQALTHVLLSAGAGHAGTAAPAAASAEAHHGTATHGLAPHVLEHVLEQGPLMVVAHALGAVALGLWLAVGESALWHLVALTAGRIRVAVLARRSLTHASLVGVHHASRRLPVPAPLHLALPDTLPHRLVTRRGPPALLAA